LIQLTFFRVHVETRYRQPSPETTTEPVSDAAVVSDDVIDSEKTCEPETLSDF